MTIFHIATLDDWEQAERDGRYEAPSLVEEGFIHCSDRHQVTEVANRLFRARRDLVLLTIDEQRLVGEVRREDLVGGGELYPHVYGPIELEAVVEVREMTPTVDGGFEQVAE